MMDDYISRQAAIRNVCEKECRVLKPCNAECGSIIALRELPSADVQPVRHGRWNCGDDIFEYAVCSYCKWDSGEAWEYAKKYFKYCPNCGARMGGDADG